MAKKAPLTSEELNCLYHDKFELSIAAIRLAQHNMVAGKDFSIASLLESLKKNPQYVEQLEPVELPKESSDSAE